MKKVNYKKIILGILCLFMVGTIFATDTVTGPFDSSTLTPGDQNVTNIPNNLSNPLSKITGTVVTIFQLLALGGIIYTGVRYMRLGAEGKAQMKSSLIYLLIGCVVVFTGSTIVKFIVDSFGDAI